MSKDNGQDKNASLIAFHKDGEQVGALRVDNGKIIFVGDTDASAKMLFDTLIDKIQPAFNQEVRKALDNIEVPPRAKDTDPDIDDEYELGRHDGEYYGYNEAVRKYTANISETRKKYE